MNEQKSREKVQLALDTTLSSLQDDPWLAQKVLANAKGQGIVKKKLSMGLILVIVLVLAAVTALAAALTDYFGGFAKLEDTYGEYEQWPGSAKVELVQLMLDNGVLGADTAAGWDALQDQEAAAEGVLARYFADITYVDTYSAMVRELGVVEQWTDQQRALYASLLVEYGKLVDATPLYLVPGKLDMSREQAVAQARDAMLQMLPISEDEMDDMSMEVDFSIDKYNLCGAPKDEPFWTVKFGDAPLYRIYITRDGEMLGVTGILEQSIPCGQTVSADAEGAISGLQNITSEEAIAQSRTALAEVMNVPCEELNMMDASAYFLYSSVYCQGDKPIWSVNWSKQGKAKWQVLLGYDGSYIYAEPMGNLGVVAGFTPFVFPK